MCCWDAIFGSPEGQAMFRDDGLAELCLNYTGRAAEMAATIVAENR